ncbi:MAG: hypothetical protein RIE77_03940 [Phycisphaerales bacterium]|jgi:hypothetical protein
MPRLGHVLTIVLLAAAACLARQDQPADQQARMRSMVDLRNLAMAVTTYSFDQSTMPGDVKALFDLGVLAERHGQPSEDGASLVSEGGAHEYIGLAGVSPSEVPDWGDIAIAHRSFDQAFAVEPTPDNPDGALVPVAFLDSHVEMVSLAEARWLVEESRKTLAAVRDGAPLPMYRQVERDAARLAQAMQSYAARHDGLAPPDWASTMAYLERLADEQDDADLLKIYLSPRARETTFIPEFESDEERSEWINANSTWTSDAHGANLWRVPNPAFTVLLSATSDAWVRTPDRRLREHVRRLAFAMVDTRADLVDREVLEARRRDSRALYDAIRDGTPLPPLDDAMHDLRALSIAIASYAKANDGYLPGELGELVPHLRGLWGVYEREPSRVFLVRADESPALVASEPDAEWVRTHGSYVYLGDPTVRLRDLRGSEAGILIHAPLDRPFLIESSIENDKRVPFAGPLLGVPTGQDGASALPLYLFPAEFLEQQAAASRQAIEALSER